MIIRFIILISLGVVVSDIEAQLPEIVEDIWPGQYSSNPSWHRIEYNNKLYFAASTDIFWQELWVGNGSESGTYMLKDINTTRAGSPQ